MGNNVTAMLIAVPALMGAAPLDTELVVNGGAETGDITGWTGGGIDAVAATGPAVGFGEFVFTGSTGPETQTLRQTIDVSGNSADIDTGNLVSVFAVYLQSRQAGSAIDWAFADLSFLDAAGGVLGSASFVDNINTDQFDWNYFSDSRLVPGGTRDIDILLTSTRTIGGSSDGFFDEISLRLVNSDADGDGFLYPEDNCTAEANDQRDTDLDGIGNACDADFDQDCFVGFADLNEMKLNFFIAGDLHTDMDGNGDTDFGDLNRLKLSFFSPPGPSGAPNLCAGGE